MNRTQFLRNVAWAAGVFIVAVACLAAPVRGEDATIPAQVDVRDQLHVDRFSLVTLDLPEDGSESIVTPITLDGVEYLMVLDLYSVRGVDFRVLVPGADGTLTEAAVPPARTYRGVLAERPDSRVAASLNDGRLTGVIVCAGGVWGLQPLTSVDQVTHAVYRQEDLRPVEGTCGTDMLEPPEEAGLREDEEGAGGQSPLNRGCSKICEIAFDADYEFYQLNGSSVSNTIADVGSVVNAMEVIYDRDTEIVYELTTVIVRDSEPDPYSSTDAGTLLDQFKNEWRTNQTGVVRDTAHLMTGKNLNGSVIGVAWVGVICNLNSGYGLSQSRFTGNFIQRVGLTSHEVGHNWNAGHCDGDADCYIMCSGLGGCAGDLTQFGSRSVSSIVSHRNSRPCLTEDGPNILTQPTPSQTVCAGDLVTLSISVDTLFPTYQWRQGITDLVDDGVHIFGATGDTLYFVDITHVHAASDYNCVVTNTFEQCSVTSDDAEIIADTDLPVVTQQPQDQTVTAGDFVFFSVTVENSFFMDYQWRKDTVPLSDDGHFFGTTTDTLVILSAEQPDEGEYDCVVAFQLGAQCSTTSDAATLTVNPGGNDCPEDLDGDGYIGLADLAILLASYGQPGGPEDGDLDGDGTVGLSDLAQLLAAYGQDCPTQ